ncbi:Ferric aerobactin receptor [Escherichia coli]|nr:Ferric aerobactin receptor [Escherichia coli]
MEFEAGTKSGFSSSKDHDERIAGAVSGGNDISPDVFPWHIRNLAAGLTVTAMPPC